MISINAGNSSEKIKLQYTFLHDKNSQIRNKKELIQSDKEHLQNPYT